MRTKTTRTVARSRNWTTAIQKWNLLLRRRLRKRLKARRTFALLRSSASALQARRPQEQEEDDGRAKTNPVKRWAAWRYIVK